jgi:hypothetical protein
MLGCLECEGGWGIYSPNHQNGCLGWLLSHRTVQCACHVTQPLDSDRWSFCLLVHRTGPVDCPVRLLAPALTSARAGAHCRTFIVLCRRPLARSSRCSAGTPDSPMNYSGAASQIPGAGKFRVDLPGAPDIVRWHTRQSGAPD